MEEPLVSIITPVYQSEQFIAETCRSVANQTYCNWEHIIVDDCSSDKSWEILNNLAKQDNRIRLYRLDKNSGSGVARNLAIKEARGRYISFIDSDDVWIQEKLERHIAFMMRGNYAFSHTSYGYVTEAGDILPKEHHVRKKPVTYRYLLRKTDISCLTAVYDQEQIGKFYMPEIRRKQDYGLWLAILKSGVNSIPYPDVLAYYRQRKDSATGKKSKLIIQHYVFLRTNEKLSVISSIWYTLCWGVGGIFKYLV